VESPSPHSFRKERVGNSYLRSSIRKKDWRQQEERLGPASPQRVLAVTAGVRTLEPTLATALGCLRDCLALQGRYDLLDHEDHHD
jgi:hypothetical protein